MAMSAATPGSSIAWFHRLVGLVNLSLAVVCIGTPAIGSLVGVGVALLLAACLLAGAGLMFFVARYIDPRPLGAFATLSDSIGERGAQKLAAD
jgi:hypothetical protein